MKPEKETIRLDRLSIGYRGKDGVTTVAGGICASIRCGELTCLLGANGVGKSTLLRTLSYFQPSLSGSVYINGREMSTFGDRELARTIGVVLTDKPDTVNMTVRELVCLGRSPYTGFWGTCSQEDMNVVAEAMAMVGIDSLDSRMVSTLSDGERQKVMIAKALAQQTPVIYLDEPTAFLDFPSKVEIMQLLHRISHTMQKTVFLSTHDLELALQIADTVWLLSSGGALTIGSPEDMALDGSLSSFFSGRGISFDQQTGLFTDTAEIVRRIHISGCNGPRMAMVRKALHRRGIETTDEVLSDEISIEVTMSAFRIVFKDGSSSYVSTVAELMEFV